jgi:hypothetical protein
MTAAFGKVLKQNLAAHSQDKEQDYHSELQKTKTVKVKTLHPITQQDD